MIARLVFLKSRKEVRSCLLSLFLNCLKGVLIVLVEKYFNDRNILKSTNSLKCNIILIPGNRHKSMNCKHENYYTEPLNTRDKIPRFIDPFYATGLFLHS